MTKLAEPHLVHTRCPLHVNHMLHELLAASISLSAILDKGRLQENKALASPFTNYQYYSLIPFHSSMVVAWFSGIHI